MPELNSRTANIVLLQVEPQSLSTLEPLHVYMTEKYNTNTAISWF